jgi:hypothetical protein
MERFLGDREGRRGERDFLSKSMSFLSSCERSRLRSSSSLSLLRGDLDLPRVSLVEAPSILRSERSRSRLVSGPRLAHSKRIVPPR